MKELLKKAYDALPFKQELFTALRWVRPPERIYRHLHFHGIVRVAVPGGRDFRIRHHGYLIENELFWRGLDGWEKVSTGLWASLCREATCVLDVGANTGVYALLAKTVNPGADIVALEPIERVFRKLEDNIALNGGGIRAYQAAASDANGTAIIYDQPSEHVLSVSLNKDFNTTEPGLVEVPVRTRTLDSLVDELGWKRVDLVKIDTETHEPEVLEGFRRTLERDRPTLLIEILNDEVAAKVEGIIGGLGYLYFNIDEVNPPMPKEHLSRSDHFNFLVCTPKVARGLGLPVH